MRSSKLPRMEFLGLRTLIYSTMDLQESKRWWSAYLRKQPYFDQPFYVGFDIGGYELGLTPTESQPKGPVTYFGVDDIQVAVAKAIENGASVEEEINDVGDGIFVATLHSPRGERFGLILNPNFRAKD